MNLAQYRAVVLETNVLMTASEHAPQASDECVRQCVGVIEQVKQGAPTLALDDSGLILDEYHKCLRAYPDSVGYMFLRKWLDSNWHNIVSGRYPAHRTPNRGSLASCQGALSRDLIATTKSS
jgi:hypothetical protein